MSERDDMVATLKTHPREYALIEAVAAYIRGELPRETMFAALRVILATPSARIATPGEHASVTQSITVLSEFLMARCSGFPDCKAPHVALAAVLGALDCAEAALLALRQTINPVRLEQLANHLDKWADRWSHNPNTKDYWQSMRREAEYLREIVALAATPELR